MIRISVIIPTIKGREEHYRRCVAAYQTRTAGFEAELITEHDHRSAGAGWQAGAERATGDFLHFTADDIEPHPGWAAPAVQALTEGYVPAPRVVSPSGELQYLPEWGRDYPDWTPVHMSVLPMITRALWEGHVRPLFTGHYFCDDWISWRAAQAGYTCRLRTGYSFTHHWAQHGRGAGMTQNARLQHDNLLFAQAREMANMGTWDRPWPP